MSSLSRARRCAAVPARGNGAPGLACGSTNGRSFQPIPASHFAILGILPRLQRVSSSSMSRIASRTARGPGSARHSQSRSHSRHASPSPCRTGYASQQDRNAARCGCVSGRARPAGDTEGEGRSGTGRAPWGSRTPGGGITPATVRPAGESRPPGRTEGAEGPGGAGGIAPPCGTAQPGAPSPSGPAHPPRAARPSGEIPAGSGNAPPEKASGKASGGASPKPPSGDAPSPPSPSGNPPPGIPAAPPALPRRAAVPGAASAWGISVPAPFRRPPAPGAASRIAPHARTPLPAFRPCSCSCS